MKPFILILCLSLSLSIHAEEEHEGHKHEESAEAGHSDHNGHGKEEHDEHEGHKHDESPKAEHSGHDHHGEEGEEHHDEHGEEGHEEGEEEASSSVGPGNAVTAADKHTGLQLSPEALKTLALKTQPLPETALLPKSAIVAFKDETGVYRLRGGWYKLVEGNIQPQGALIRFTPRDKSDLRPGDHVVVEGAPLLRVTELDAFSSGEAGHAH